MRRMPLRNLVARLVAVAAALLVTWQLPWRFCAREADRWWNNELEPQIELAAGLTQWVEQGLSEADYQTGADLFNGEWLFGTYLMAGLGAGQIILQNPDLERRFMPLMTNCIDHLLQPAVRAFDTRSWNSDAFATLHDNEQHHAAYLGYLNLLLSMHRLIDAESAYAERNDDITSALVRRMETKKSIRLLSTYPGERYPVDNCASVGSIGLYDKATGSDHSKLLARWDTFCRSTCIDPTSGLLIQATGPNHEPFDDPRASGTTLGLYFLSFALPDLAADLYEATKSSVARHCLGFGAVREYPTHVHGGYGDIDSGPIIFGFSFSATGFAIAGTRITQDEAFFRRLFASATLAGAPFVRNGQRSFVTGGPLGTAILFAMFTALPAQDWEAL